ncbi:Uncharacterized [Syntrophomonas zehnderi OL-4]|uniref:Uncharacterized n=1 Tax=Syntrophomonas zehnderi OL-4 TaxID=690567 RepID=A0A0E4GAV7_9FIRM|nr:hypothetical protein [Syntrophomonas zehnderi]CFX23536.1 Uncharacterized [Syntrophomonas zehnderi OL-4]
MESKDFEEISESYNGDSVIVYGRNPVWVDSLLGDNAQVTFSNIGEMALVDADDLEEATLPDDEENYLFDYLTRYSPIIRS